jgi:hypothetical protein
MTELNWAFAGTSTTTPAEYSSTTNGERALAKPMHTKWKHWIDSDTEEEVKDEGDMFLQSDGTVLEEGVNEDGSTYEELWEEAEGKITGNDKLHVSYVLRAEDSSKRTRGMVIRIGEWIQGTLRVGSEFTVSRWQWSMEKASYTVYVANVVLRWYSPNGRRC